MKNIKHYFALLVIVIIGALIVKACKKDDTPAPVNNIILPTSTIIGSGTWYVSSYHENSIDHTNNFNGYIFTFNSNGTMFVTNAGVSTSGNWSNDDSHNEFHILVGSTPPLTDISNGWLIVSRTTLELDLKDADTQHNEVLHFTKK